MATTGQDSSPEPAASGARSRLARSKALAIACAVPVAVAIAVLLHGCDAAADETLFGFNDDADPSGFELQTSLAMPVRRLVVPWDVVEPARGRWDWTEPDRHYSGLLAAGLRPLLVAAGAPCWSHPSLPCDPATQAPPDADFDSDWFEYVRRLAARYPAAIGIEIWNEPNVTATFQPRPEPVRFAILLELAHKAVEGVDPELPVISGGVFPSSVSDPSVAADRQFLAGVYDAGAKGAMDAIGVHLFPAIGRDGSAGYDLDTVDAALERVRAARDAAGDSSTPIWVTEMGVSTEAAPPFSTGVSDAEQAEGLLAMIEIVEDAPDVPVVVIHRLVDEPRDRADSPAELAETGFGVFRSDGTPKPAACALSRELEGSLAC